MKRRRRWWLLVPAFAIAAIAGSNYFAIQLPLATALGSDPRNEGISAFAHYRWFVYPDVLVFDLRGVSGANSEADVLRSFLQFARSVQSHRFKTVVLE